MRILLTLQPSIDIFYKNDYYYDIQGFIYNIIRYSKFHNIHDKKGYKFFCFSNIFPYNKILNKNKIYYLLISSPDDELVEYIYKILLKRIGDLIYFGKMSFYLITLKFFSVQVPPLKNFILKTETPIIIRIPSKMLDAEKKYNYYYWKKEFSIDLFISQIEKNLYKKYEEFIEYKRSYVPFKAGQIKDFRDTNSITLFEKFMFKKQISMKITIGKTKHIIIGSLWEFHFEGWHNQELIQFALDVGLGERNSLGFGFLNVTDND